MTLFFPTEIIPGTTQGNINEFTLQQIIAMALENNRDLTVALLNIEQAKAAYQIKKSDELPVIAGSTGLSRQGIPEDNSSSGEAYTTDTSMSVGLGITAYELDFFGRVKSLSQSALESYLPPGTLIICPRPGMTTA